MKHASVNKKALLLILLLPLFALLIFYFYNSASKNKDEAPKIGEIVKRSRQTNTKYLGLNETGEAKFAQTSSLAPVNYKKDDKWYAYDYNLVKSHKEDYAYKLASSDFQIYFKEKIGQGPLVYFERMGQHLTISPSTLSWVNDAGEVQKIADPKNGVKAHIKDNTITYKNLYGKGIDLKFTTSVQGAKKELVINDFSALPAPKIKDPKLSLTLIVSKDNSLNLSDTQDKKTWNLEENITTNISEGVIFSDQNPKKFDRNYDGKITRKDNIAFAFPPAIAQDSSKNLPPESSLLTSSKIQNSQNNTKNLGFAVSKRRDHLLFSVTTPYTWLQNATYPVKIDPTTTFTVSAGSDDGFWVIGETTFDNDGESLAIGTFFEGPMGTYLRFPNISVPRGSNISNSKIQLVAAQNDYSGGTTNVTITAQDSDSPSAPTTASEADSASRTTASVNWSSSSSNWTPGTTYESPDISSIVQEVVNRSGWSSGNPIILFFDDIDSTGVQIASSYQNTTYTEPKLVITYTAPSPTPTPTPIPPTPTPTPIPPTPTPTPLPGNFRAEGVNFEGLQIN